MTNKINGIDVSECSYYNKDNEPYCCEVWDNECEAQNCYFKQLKRLQEENEELKTNIELMQTALYAIRFSCKLKLEEGQKALHIEPIMRIIDEVLKNE